MKILSELRKANIERVKIFKNRHGHLVHPTGKEWSPKQWMQAVIGEIGEYANVRKKFERGDLSVSEFEIKASHELADVFIYLDLLSNSLGLELKINIDFVIGLHSEEFKQYNCHNWLLLLNKYFGELSHLINEENYIKFKETLDRHISFSLAIIYALSYDIHVDLEKAIIQKFNIVSDRIGCDIKIGQQ